MLRTPTQQSNGLQLNIRNEPFQTTEQENITNGLYIFIIGYRLTVVVNVRERRRGNTDYMVLIGSKKQLNAAVISKHHFAISFAK